MLEYIKKHFTSDGEVAINGNKVPYISTAEDFPISNTDGEVEATTFTFSYERSDLADKSGRPVLFAWNGGPLSASVYLHIGLLAPMRVVCGEGPDMPQTAPFQMMENDHCLLDICDIVVVDAMGTGYARVLKPEAKNYWFTSEHDAEAFVITIRKWLTAHKRWNSPIYILGESYGTIRNALLAEGIYSNGHDATMMHLSGIIMLGSALNHAQQDFPIPKSVLNLPSIAAAQWYWHPEGKGTLEEFVEQCDDFCYREYLQALACGRKLTEEKKLAVAEKLHLYTGYPIKKLLDDDLDVKIFDYPANGLAAEEKSIGIDDARFSLGKIKDPAHYECFADDASSLVSMPSFTACFNAIWKDRLNIDLDEEYQLQNMAAGDTWEFKTEKYPPVALENAMRRNPKLKLMFGMGWYDMLTTPGWCRYLINHYDFPSDRTYTHYYKGGHMPYLGDRSAAQLEDDIRSFILA